MAKDLDSFWKWVQIRMDELGISSTRELARKAGVSHGTINNQKNRLKPPTIETAEGLCRALQVSWEELWMQAGYIRGLDKDHLQGLDAELYYAVRDRDEEFKKALLKTAKAWGLYEDLK